MIRASIGISVPDSPVGYPFPFHFSWWYSAIFFAICTNDSSSTPFRIFSTIFAPSAGWRFISAYSASVYFPGFLSTASSMAIFPRSCMGAAFSTCFKNPFSKWKCSWSCLSCAAKTLTTALVRLICPPVFWSRLSTISAMPRISMSFICMMCSVFSVTSSSSFTL